MAIVTSNNDARFRIEVWNAAETVQYGDIYDVSDITITYTINQVGSASFTVPLGIISAFNILPGSVYKIYSTDYPNAGGLIGRYIHAELNTNVEDATATITADDQLVLLSQQTTKWGLAFADSDALSTVLNGLLVPAGWTGTYSLGSPTQTPYAFEGDNIIAAIEHIRKFQQIYYRINGNKNVYFGTLTDIGIVYSLYGGFQYGSGLYFGDMSAVPSTYQGYLINVDTYPVEEDQAGTYITKCTRHNSSRSMVNRITPTAAGNGEGLIDLRYSTRGGGSDTYKIINDTTKGCRYLEDSATGRNDAVSGSKELYGLREITLNVPEIKPVTLNPADLESAANALFDYTSALLRRFKEPQNVYTFEVIRLPTNVVPGSLVLVDYHGVIESDSGRVATLTLDHAPFYVIAITSNYSSGIPTFSLTVSNNGEDIQDTVDIISSIATDFSKFRIHAQPSIAYYTKVGPTSPVAYERTFNTVTQPASIHDWQFYMGKDILKLFEMRLELYVQDLWTGMLGGDSTPKKLDHANWVGLSSLGDAVWSNGASVYDLVGYDYDSNYESSIPKLRLELHDTYGAHQYDPGILLSGGNYYLYGKGYAYAVHLENNITRFNKHNHNMNRSTNLAHTHAAGFSPYHYHPNLWGIRKWTSGNFKLKVKLNGTYVTGTIYRVAGSTLSAVASNEIISAGQYVVDITSMVEANGIYNRQQSLNVETASTSGLTRDVLVTSSVWGRVLTSPIDASYP